MGKVKTDPHSSPTSLNYSKKLRANPLCGFACGGFDALAIVLLCGSRNLSRTQ